MGGGRGMDVVEGVEWTTHYPSTYSLQRVPASRQTTQFEQLLIFLQNISAKSFFMEERERERKNRRKEKFA